ncbi:hypothetical protein SteCoe_18925 [Stentor coeruleus]|uniref:Uncharacterized protein n=1 Tax=Stentor coeruleus TaxID=5963 RepID=A0A1R2BVK4_9CILI|nr:hypothetical protein SteCoe_18925 [Stentor coeruleus]
MDDNEICAYIGIKSSNQNKKAIPSRVESLIDRGVASSAKINSLKIKQKARELKELRSVPQINEKSRKLAEGMKRERLDLISKPDDRNPRKSPDQIQEPIKVSVNILKQLEKTEESAKAQPDLKNMTIHERTKYWKEQKDKKLEEQRKAKKDQELDGCTFKPKKPEIQEFEANKLPFENKNIGKGVKNYEENIINLKTVKSVGKIELLRNNTESIAMILKGKEVKQGNGFMINDFSGQGVKNGNSCEGRAVSAVQPVRIKAGFLSELAKPRGK